MEKLRETKNLRVLPTDFCRRDWIRTSDPYYPKVVRITGLRYTPKKIYKNNNYITYFKANMKI